MEWQTRKEDACTGEHQDSGGNSLPTTFKEFLLAENLSDWPCPMALEGPLDIQGEGLLLGTQEDIADVLRESAPLGLGLLDELDQCLQAVEEKLNSYAVHIITEEKRPSRLAERLFHSPTRTFLTDMQNAGAFSSRFSSRGPKNTDFVDTMMETKKRSLDYCIFPGFRHGELVELPAQLEAPPLLHKITKIQKFNSGFRKFWKKLFLSEASAAIMQDSFWWIFLDKFNKEEGLAEEKDLLFDRIADSYVALFFSINSDVKDKFLSVYPDCLAQTVFFAYTAAFPESCWRFDDSFKQYLINLIHEWVTGLKPVPGTWKTWNMRGLEASSGLDGEASATTKKMMEAAALNKKVDVSLDMESFERLVDQLGKEQDARPQGSGDINKPGGIGGIAAQIKKTAKESHQIGPGPDYEKVKFNTQGRSPLIAHYLHMHQLRDFRQPGKKVRRLEIAKVPPPAPTYQQFIEDTVAVSDALSREYTRVCEATDQEILELEWRKREVNRAIDGLKKELTFCKSAAERKAMLEQFEEIKEMDKDVSVLDHKPDPIGQDLEDD